MSVVYSTFYENNKQTGTAKRRKMSQQNDKENLNPLDSDEDFW